MCHCTLEMLKLEDIKLERSRKTHLQMKSPLREDYHTICVVLIPDLARACLGYKLRDHATLDHERELRSTGMGVWSVEAAMT